MDIVEIDNRFLSRGVTELTKKIRDPMKVNNSGNDRTIFDFSRGACNCVLFLGTPRNWIALELYNEHVGRRKIIFIFSLVSIKVGM